MSEQRSYRVRWEIDVTAGSMDEAVRQVCSNYIPRTPEGAGWVFDVLPEGATIWTTIDTEQEPSLRDDAREMALGSHKFGDDPMAALLWLFTMDSSQDEEAGNAVDWHYWCARFGKRVLYCLSSGLVYVWRCADEDEAKRTLERVREEWDYVRAEEEDIGA